MSTSHLTFGLRKHRKYLAHADILITPPAPTGQLRSVPPIQCRSPSSDPRAIRVPPIHPSPQHPSSGPSARAGPQLRSHPRCGPPPSDLCSTHPVLRARLPITSVLRAPSSDPRATPPAWRVPFFQERTPNLTVWGKTTTLGIVS